MNTLEQLIAKKAKGDSVAKMAVALRDEVDRDLDTMAKAHAAEHDTNYYDSYAAVTADGVGLSMLKNRENADRLVMGEAHHVADAAE